jgi:hypothetical protein
MKVVINQDFGGFGLSNLAFEKLLQRKGIAFEKSKSSEFGMSHYFRAGHLNEDDFYLSEYDFYESRNDADLIAVVEELKTLANSQFSSLKIIEIPDDIEWEVHEYDGREHVAEKHRTWY